MFAKQTTDTVTIESPKGPVVVTIQKLNWKVQQEAYDIRYEQAIARAARLTASQSSVALATVLATRAAQVAERESRQQSGEQASDGEAPPPPVDLAQLREDRYRQYDKGTVLRGGVQSWSDKETPLPAGVDGLEHAAAETLHRAILDLTLPALDAATRERERKNG